MAHQPATQVASSPVNVLPLTVGATFMAFLDTTVVNIAFPALHASFPGTSLTDLSWVVSGFAVAFAALLSPAGRLADAAGRRPVFLISVAGFSLASLLCALAPDFGTLLAGRVLQGLTAAGMIPSALGLTLAETPPGKRVAAVGVWGAASSVAAAAGPSLGGVLVDATNWRSVFLINVPIGAAVIVGSARWLPRRRPVAGTLPDLIGTVSSALGIGAIVLGLTKGTDWGWGSSATIGSLAFGTIMISSLALPRSRRHPAPAIQFTLWRNPVFALANLTSLLSGAALFSWLLAGPLFLTTFWGYSVLGAGLAVTPSALASAVAAFVAGRMVRQRHLPAVIIASVLVFGGVGLWLETVLSLRHMFLTVWLPAGVIGGAAFGIALTALATVAALSVPP
ncbi:MAG: MFS transporter, partial [Nocardiopsaceae bacterium]|nr:MFS transporter [Nocardiopsaceae bacterium]